MSRRAEALVWERSRAKGSNLLALLFLADCAQQDGRDAWPNPPAIAKAARLTARAAQYVLRKLEEDGEIVIERNTLARFIQVGSRRLKPRWFIHVRCVCDWGAYSREKSENISEAPTPASDSLSIPEDSGGERKTLPMHGDDPPEKSGEPIGNISTSDRKNPVAHIRKDPRTEPRTKNEEEQGQAGAAPRLQPEQDPEENVGVITVIAHEVIDQIGLHPDLTESVKALCAQRHVAYNSGVVRKAIESATWQRRRRAGLSA